MPTALKSDMKSTTKGEWTLGDAFRAKCEHHESMKALWETKWRLPVHNFHGGLGNIGTHAMSSARKVSIHFTMASSRTSSPFLRHSSR